MIDVLIQNAGINDLKDLELTSKSDLDNTCAVDAKGPYFTVQACNHLWYL